MRMGVPVAPRNIFPSNIQGLPTWYEIRVTEAGHLGARGGVDMMVAMNPQTWDADVASIEPGGYLFYDSAPADAAGQVARRHQRDRRAADRDLQRRIHRSAPAPAVQEHHLRRRAVGACSTWILPNCSSKLISEQYKGKDKLLDSERPRAASRPRLREGAISNARSDCASSAPTRSATGSCIEGNARPRSAPSMAAPPCAPGIRSRHRRRSRRPSPKYCEKFRHEPDTGKAKYAIVQAEDELASIGMVIGAGLERRPRRSPRRRAPASR